MLLKISNAAQMREIDRYAINTLGIPSTLLMTNAAEQVARAAMPFVSIGGCAAVFCGSGNNGGDGIAAASYLKKQGVHVRAFLVGSREKLTEDTKEMERRFEELDGVLEEFTENSQIEHYVNKCDVIIDAIYGIGLNAELRWDRLYAVKLINCAPARVVSADIPTGVHADTGAIMGAAVMADVTVTFSMPKAGHFITPGAAQCGEIRTVDIGIPHELIDSVQTDVFAVTAEDISLPRRALLTHKGDYGKDLIIAGSVGYTGAPLLAASAASRAGAGLVSLGVPETVYAIVAAKCEEVMPFPLSCGADSGLTAAATDIIIDKLAKSDVCLIGPGLGRSRGAEIAVRRVVRSSAVPLVLDADGINAVAENIDILDEAVCPVILTPHDGEFLRIGGELQTGDRAKAAKDFAAKHGCILVLKGYRTITAMPDGTVYINTTGGPALSKGGSGDVLSGMIAAFLGQGFPVKDAVLAAVFLHGRAGDICAEGLGEYSVIAGDIIAAIPKAICELMTK